MLLSKPGNLARLIALALTIAFLVSLIPLFAISAYDRPALDDYLFSTNTYAVWKTTGSVGSVIAAAFQEVYSVYMSWQGSYTNVFFFALQPGVFSPDFYCISPILMILFFIGANLYFFYVFLHKLLHLDVWNTLSVAILQLLISIQLLPSPAQGFYWHSVACSYLSMYSLSQILAGMLVQSQLSHKKRYMALCPFIAFFLAGCNYSTILLVLVLFIMYLGLLLIKKSVNPWHLHLFLPLLPASF